MILGTRLGWGIEAAVLPGSQGSAITFLQAQRRRFAAPTDPAAGAARAGFALGQFTAGVIGASIVVGGLVYMDIGIGLMTKLGMAAAGPVVGIYSSADSVSGSFRNGKLTFTNMKVSRTNSKESNLSFDIPSVEVDFSSESLWKRAFGSKEEKHKPFHFESVSMKGMRGSFEKTGDSPTPNFSFTKLHVEDAKVAVSESLEVKSNAIVEKRSQTVKLPDVSINSLDFKNLVLRKPDMFTGLTTTQGTGALGNQEWSVNPKGIDSDFYEVRFRDLPIEFMSSYLVYPFYLINSASLDIAMTMRKTNEIPASQQLLEKKAELLNKFNQLKGDKVEEKKEEKKAEEKKAEPEPRFLCESAVTLHNIKMTMPDQATIDKESVGRSVGAAVLAQYLQNNATKVSLGFTSNVAKSEFEPKKFGELAASSMLTKTAVETATKAWSWFSGDGKK